VTSTVELLPNLLALAVVWFLLKAMCASLSRRIDAGEGETFPASLDPDALTISAGFWGLKEALEDLGLGLGRRRGKGTRTMGWEIGSPKASSASARSIYLSI
jgi:hypothetical protein